MLGGVGLGAALGSKEGPLALPLPSFTCHPESQRGLLAPHLLDELPTLKSPLTPGADQILPEPRTCTPMVPATV